MTVHWSMVHLHLQIPKASLRTVPFPRQCPEPSFSWRQGAPGCCSIPNSPYGLLSTSASYCFLVHIKKPDKETGEMTYLDCLLCSAMAGSHRCHFPTLPLTHTGSLSHLPCWCAANHLQGNVCQCPGTGSFSGNSNLNLFLQSFQ